MSGSNCSRCHHACGSCIIQPSFNTVQKWFEFDVKWFVVRYYLVELLGRAENVGEKEVQQRPQLVKVVLPKREKKKELKKKKGNNSDDGKRI